jgi:hypothetical protein
MLKSGSQFILNLVGCISRPVDHRVNLLLGAGIDVGQKPVAQDVGLDTEGEPELTILLKVHKLSLGVLLCSRRSLNNVGIVGFGWFGSRSVSLNRKLENGNGSLESLNRLNQVALAELRGCRNLSLVDRAAKREDRAIFVDL